jgi:hypothetical protein
VYIWFFQCFFENCGYLSEPVFGFFWEPWRWILRPGMITFGGFVPYSNNHPTLGTLVRLVRTVVSQDPPVRKRYIWYSLVSNFWEPWFYIWSRFWITLLKIMVMNPRSGPDDPLGLVHFCPHCGGGHKILQWEKVHLRFTLKFFWRAHSFTSGPVFGPVLWEPWLFESWAPAW